MFVGAALELAEREDVGCSVRLILCDLDDVAEAV